MSLLNWIIGNNSSTSGFENVVTVTNVTNGSHKVGLDTTVIDSLDRIHTRTHQGKAFVVSHIFSIAASTTVNCLIDLTTGGIHAAFQINSGADSRLEFFEGSTVTAAGTALSVINSNRSVNTATAHKFYQDPTVSNFGTTLCSFYIPGGAGTFAAGGEGGSLPRGGAEWVLSASQKYVLSISNRSNAAIEAGMSMTFYINN